jgi:hypothetical protein
MLRSEGNATLDVTSSLFTCYGMAGGAGARLVAGCIKCPSSFTASRHRHTVLSCTLCVSHLRRLQQSICASEALRLRQAQKHRRFSGPRAGLTRRAPPEIKTEWARKFSRARRRHRKPLPANRAPQRGGIVCAMAPRNLNGLNNENVIEEGRASRRRSVAQRLRWTGSASPAHACHDTAPHA